jgi:hypothetical protein
VFGSGRREGAVGGGELGPGHGGDVEGVEVVKIAWKRVWGAERKGEIENECVASSARHRIHSPICTILLKW